MGDNLVPDGVVERQASPEQEVHFVKAADSLQPKGEEQMEGERTGVVTGLNIHDYRSNSTGVLWDGCMAILTKDDGNQAVLYTKSHRLQAALVMSFSGRVRVTVFYEYDAEGQVALEDLAKEAAGRNLPRGSVEGVFTVKAVWNMPPK